MSQDSAVMFTKCSLKANFKASERRKTPYTLAPSAGIGPATCGLGNRLHCSEAPTSDNKHSVWRANARNLSTSDKWRREGDVHFLVHSILDIQKDNPSQTLLSPRQAILSRCALVIAGPYGPALLSLVPIVAP